MAIHNLNVLGEMCPIPDLKARQAIAGLAIGDSLVVETDHRCAVTAIRNEMKRMGHRVKVLEVMSGVWQIEVTKLR